MLTGFIGASYYCEYCDIGYNQNGAHRCADGCEYCYSDVPCIRGERYIVWTVKELFIVETVLLSTRQ